MSDSKIKVKINNNDDTRVWRYTNEDDFNGLIGYIASVWNNNDFIIQYQDDEGDLITIASKQDLKDAFTFIREENKKSLKLFVRNFVKQKRTPKPQDSASCSSDPEEKKDDSCSSTSPNKTFNSVHEMVFDFLSNTAIISLLPEFFGNLVVQVQSKDCNVSQDEISSLIYAELKDEKYAVIRSHILYDKYASLAIPYISHRVYMQQSLYKHFRLETIKTWIIQLIETLNTAVEQSCNSGVCAFKNIVVDIEYPPVTDTGKVIHFGVECDLCGEYPIVGDRYKCSMCRDWDCCSACEPKHDHPLIKFKKSSKKHENASFKGLTEILKRLNGGNGCGNVCGDEEKGNGNGDGDGDVMVCDCDCICGSKMACVVARRAYGQCNTVYCDECGAQFFKEKIYHCPKGYDEVYHPRGYDLCLKCGERKMLSEKEKEKETEESKPSEEAKEKGDLQDVENVQIVPVEQVDVEVEVEMEEEEEAVLEVNNDDKNEDVVVIEEDVVEVEPEPEVEPEVEVEDVEVDAAIEAKEEPESVVAENDNDNDGDENDKDEDEVEVEVIDEFEFAKQLVQIKDILAIEGNDRDLEIKEMLVENNGDIQRVVPILLGM